MAVQAGLEIPRHRCVHPAGAPVDDVVGAQREDGILVGGDLNVLVLVPGIVIGVEGARVLLILEGVSLDRVEGLTPASIFVFSMD